ncbi:MAG: insulinase family protein [Gemmatimonadota bacterium]|jgi:zinc protease|nr:insulinase family protein [Gemmatimonadota bacterium]
MREGLLKPLRIPQRSTTLSNGLRVVVHEDHTAPIVAVHLMYHAGSKDEQPGRTGLAHLLEHLLFEGSLHCPKGSFDRMLERVGGTNNGSTWFDRTNYYEVVPSHAVELALWLERDRMAHFLPVLNNEIVEVQRSVVMNERRQVYENRPYGMAFERLNQLLFPPDHPYSWPTIGYMPDLEVMELADARSFYQRYYTPDNAVLVLAGDVNTEEGFAWAEKYLGDITPGGNPPVQPGPLDPGPSGRIEVMEDRVTFPRIYHATAVAPFGSDDWVALDVLSYLLADGESSRLQRTLIREEQIAQDVDTYLYPTQLTGIFGFVATSRSGVEPDRLIAAIDKVVAGVAEGGVTEVELEGAIRRARKDQLQTFSTVEDLADELAYVTTVLGAPEQLEELVNRYVEVTAEDIARVARRYLAPERRATVIVIPGAGGTGSDEGIDDEEFDGNDGEGYSFE